MTLQHPSWLLSRGGGYVDIDEGGAPRIRPLAGQPARLLDAGGNHYYNVTSADLAADRVLNLPLLLGTDTLAVLDLAQTFTNKTLTAPVINGVVTTTGLTLPAHASGAIDMANALITNIGAAGTDFTANGGLTMAGNIINAFTSVASTPAGLFSGTWYTGGTATTTKPHLLIEPTGTTSTAWSTSGTGLGINAPAGFGGNMLDVQLNGSSVFRVLSNSGAIFGSYVQMGSIYGGAADFILTPGSTSFQIGNRAQTAILWDFKSVTGATTLTTVATAGGVTALTITQAAHTAVIAEKFDLLINAHTLTITGNYATQRFVNFASPTVTSAGAQTITTVIAYQINGPLPAGSAVFTNSVTLDLPTYATNGTTASTLRIAAPTGASANWAVNVIAGASNFQAMTVNGAVTLGVQAAGVGLTIFNDGTWITFKRASDSAAIGYLANHTSPGGTANILSLGGAASGGGLADQNGVVAFYAVSQQALATGTVVPQVAHETYTTTGLSWAAGPILALRVGAADVISMTTAGLITLLASAKVSPASGVAGFSVVSTAYTLGSAGTVILPNADMSGAANDAARDALAGNIDGAIAVDTGIAGRVYIRDAGAWKFALFA